MSSGVTGVGQVPYGSTSFASLTGAASHKGPTGFVSDGPVRKHDGR